MCKHQQLTSGSTKQKFIVTFLFQKSRQRNLLGEPGVMRKKKGFDGSSENIMTKDPMSENTNARSYCASCRKSLGPAREDLVGEKIRCPHSTRFEPHVAYAVGDPEINWWLKLEVWLLKYQFQWSPLRLVPFFKAEKRK